MSSPYKRWLPVGLWMALIFVVSTSLGSFEHTSLIVEPLLRWLNPGISPSAIELVHVLIRKAGHLTEYAILAALILRAEEMPHPTDLTRRYWRSAGWALLLTAFYAATDEWHQSFVPGRTASPVDVLIDSIGGLLAISLATLWRKFSHRGAVHSTPPA